MKFFAERKLIMTTLRREIRKKIEEVLNHWYGEELSVNGQVVFSSVVAEDIAESVNSNNPNFFSEKPKFDLKNSDPAWNLFHGENPDNDKMIFEKQAFDAFERDMQTPDNWHWFPAKTSEEKAYKYFRDFVVEQYRKDPKCFEKYQTWRTQPYARGAMSNLAIKRNPENFPASWTDFLASSAMYGDKKQSSEVKLDDNGAPISY